MENKKKIAFIVTDFITIKAFLLNHLKILSSHYEIHIITNFKNHSYDYEFFINYNIKLIQIPFKRKINIFYDFVSLISLISIFQKNQYTLINSLTPKAGLISAMAGYLSNINYRIHIFTGQIWVTKSLPLRLFYKNIDRIIFKLSTHILVDSLSQQKFLIEQNVINDHKSRVLGYGSICGVNPNKFKFNHNDKLAIRNFNNISINEFIIVFFGRLYRDKGILDLVNVFNRLSAKYKNISLFIMGPDEEKIKSKIQNIISSKTKVFFFDKVKNTEVILNATDLLCLPSYREGFGNVVIEAASCGIPSVVSNIYGLKDSIVENQTGLFFQVANLKSLEKKIEYYYLNRFNLNKIKKMCRDRCIKFFDHDFVSKNLFDYLRNITN